MVMSQLSKGIMGAAALSLVFGAIHLASERDFAHPASLTKLALAQFGPPSLPAVPVKLSPSAAVNRAGKTDRAVGIPAAAVRSQTISLRLNGLPDTSILIRMPAAREARDSTPPSPLIKSGVGKPMVACEPSVSVLTEVAKHLQPGRCVT
ncbi:MAG TPA: hypothetical protein VHB49_26585 [Bradyrhizobium sp.]|nr:hypothetical protein [Bradyrhizobium sp.]